MQFCSSNSVESRWSHFRIRSILYPSFRYDIHIFFFFESRFLRTVHKSTKLNDDNRSDSCIYLALNWIEFLMPSFLLFCFLLYVCILYGHINWAIIYWLHSKMLSLRLSHRMKICSWKRYSIQFMSFMSFIFVAWDLLLWYSHSNLQWMGSRFFSHWFWKGWNECELEK